jgi:predicted O-methyltransferase YrrM
MLTLSDSFIQKLDSINGWLALPAAQLTLYLIQSGLAGNVLEFGVFHGKYLALLNYATQSYRSRVLGVDACLGSLDIEASKAFILSNIQDSCGECSRVTILHADTMTLSRSEILKLLPEPITFISVDAGHEADNLYNDISLAADLITPGGIIAVDDAFNHGTPGAIEGTCRYFEKNNRGRVAPFTHCYNKLFITSADHQFYYLELTKKYVQDNDHLDYCARTLDRKRDNDGVGFVPRFFGYEILPFL